MKGKIITKVIAIFVLVAILMPNTALVASEVLAAYEELEKQNIVTNNKNVEFNVYFKEGENIKHQRYQDLNSKTELYLNINFKDSGYLKNGKIILSNNNFEIIKEEVNDVRINSIKNNEIFLNQIGEEDNNEIILPIKFNKKENINIEYFGRETTASLEGIYLDNKGKERNIKSDIQIRIDWTSDAKVKVEQKLDKYFKYTKDGQVGVLLQTAVTSALEENKLPVQKNTLEIDVPLINNIKPIEVKIIAKSTLATNGEENAISFNENNWNYNYETGKITITVENNSLSDILWKSGTDEYKVILKYPIEKVENKKIDIKAINKIKAYGKEEEIIAEEVKTLELIENGTAVTADVQTTREADKGYMYANTKYETEYNTKWKAEISDKDLMDNIILQDKGEEFVSQTGEIKANNNIYYKETILNRDNMLKVLGENGVVTIKDMNENVIAIIDKDTYTDNQGNIVIQYNNQEISQIKIETTKPQEEGIIEIENKKSIKANTDYTTSQIKQMSSLRTSLQVKTENTDSEKTAEMNLKETTSKAELEISNTNLSTIIKNENIELKAILFSNSGEYDLYKNPVIEITLPSQVQNVEIKSADVLFTAEMKIKSTQILKNADGTQTIRVDLEGEQTEFIQNNINKGINVILNTDITINRLATTSDEKISMKYTNEKAISLANEGSSSQDVKIIAPTGLITLNTIENYNDNQEKVTAIENDENGKLEIATNAKIAKVTMQVINNNGASIYNPKLLVRVPFSGNKKTTGEDLGTNINATLGQMQESGVAKIYYSENGEATEDLLNSNNAWIEQPQDMSKIKSFMLVFNDYELKQSEEITYSYTLNIPEKLSHNQSLYTTYTIYYELKNENGIVSQSKVAPTIGLSTGAGPVINAKITNSVGEITDTNKVVKYQVTVENTGTETAEKVKITVPVPEKMIFVEYNPELEDYRNEFTDREDIKTVEIELGDIKQGEKIERNFYLKALETGEVEIKATLTASNLEKTIELDTMKIKVDKAYFDLYFTKTSTDSVLEDKEFKYCLSVTNLTDQNINKVKAQIKLDDNLIYKDAYIIDAQENQSDKGIDYDNNTKMLTFDLGTINSKNNLPAFKKIELNVTTNKLTSGVQSANVKTQVTVNGENIPEHKTEELLTKIVKSNLEVNMTCSKKEGYLKIGDLVDYTVEIKNNGDAIAENVVGRVTIPENLRYISTKYKINDLEKEIYVFNDGKSEMKFDILPGKTATMVVHTIVSEIIDSSKPEEDANVKVEVEQEDKEPITDEITYTIQNEEPTNNNDDENNEDNSNENNNSGGNSSSGSYNISGRAWLDENNNGQRDSEEKVLSGIKILVIDANTGKEPKNSNGDVINATTAEDGKYTLVDLAKGTYIVIFEYDTEKYELAQYKKQGVDEARNSDVVEGTMNGEKKVAITNNIELNASTANIDIGLTTKNLFDLKLDKSITKVTMQEGNKNKSNTYEGSKLAKIDVDGKKIDQTSLVVEYKIVVTNEGNIPGYAKKIADYVPTELKFSSELNKDWYLGESGEIINSSLAQTVINPGESREVKLILTKKMDIQGNGVVTNTAEIAESYNEYGVQDVDSIEHNKKSGEDDMSSADLIIGLKTGRIAMYIVLSLVIMVAIGVGAFYVNKKVLKI